MAKGNEVDRARYVAVRAYQEILADKTRAGLNIMAVEIRLGGASPDVTYHVSSGSQTQGGYLFFTQDLLPDAKKPVVVT